VDNLEIAIQYANDVINNTILSCIYVKQAAQQFLNILDNPEYYYDSSEVDTVVTFINQFYLTEQTKPKKFILEPWQTFIVVNIYGIYNTTTNKRKYSQIYIELARKQGKSQLITLLALYHLIFDVDSQVIISANSREQAKNVDFKKVKQFASMIDVKEKHLKQYFNKITFKNNELIVTASDSKRLDGLNASFVLIDEMHEAKDNTLYNVLKSSQGSRDDALFFIITTAGFNTESFCYSLRTYCTEVLSDVKNDDSMFSLIYTLDKDDDFTDRKNWIKANPNLNISLKEKWLEGEVNKAINNTTEKNGVLVKNFNIWLKNNTIEDWIDEKYINQSLQDISIDEERFRGLVVFGGVDLASVSDIAACSYMIQLDDKYYFFNDYYLCEDTVNSSPNRELYKQAILDKELIVTSGNVIDYDYILEDILKVNQNNYIQLLMYDKWNSTQFAINAEQNSLNLRPFAQTAGNLNKPLKEFERLIKSGNIIIQKNSLSKWMLSNVILKVNHMGNYSIDKSNRNKKIDGVASMVNALGGYLESPRNLNII